MIITFGQYSLLAATRYSISHNQLASKTQFDSLMLNYFITGLLINGLIEAVEKGNETYYELTRRGVNCLMDYEHQNPALVIPRHSLLHFN